MVNSKNSLDISSRKNTFEKGVCSRPQLDGIIKKPARPTSEENFSETKDFANNFLSTNKESKIKETEVEKIPEVIAQTIPDTETKTGIDKSSVDDSKRLFFKVAGVAGLGLAASALFPKSAGAYISGSTPTSNVVGLKSINNERINPATVEGQGVEKLTKDIISSGSSSGIVRTPTLGKKIRIYATRFSLTQDADDVSFRFTLGGEDHEKYVSPKTGGLYGANNHPNYIEGGVDEKLYCMITGTTTVQVNIDYLEV